MWELFPGVLSCIPLPKIDLLKVADKILICTASLLIASTFLSTALCRFDRSMNAGKTRLRGNLFGIDYVNATYDYVVSKTSKSRHFALLIKRTQIIGGGTAGLTIASRLAAANASVAVIEAGSFYEFDGGNASQVPGYGSTFLSFDKLAKNYQLVDWDLITPNQTARLALDAGLIAQKANSNITKGPQ